MENERAKITLADVAAKAGDEYEIDVYELRGVTWADDLEDNIRKHFRAWLAAGAAVEHEIGVLRAAMRRAMDEEGGLPG